MSGLFVFSDDRAQVFGTPRTLSIPASSYSNGQGSFQTQMPFAQGKKYVMSMSDASGFGTGGTTDVLTVGNQVGSSSCNTTDPGMFHCPASSHLADHTAGRG